VKELCWELTYYEMPAMALLAAGERLFFKTTVDEPAG
jgi:hypothetical protein